MTTDTYNTITFSNHLEKDFSMTLRERVFGYLKDNDISRFGNRAMIFKTIVMITLYIAPFVISLTGLISSPFMYVMMWCVMGFGMAGIGLSIMHDANHGSYSKHNHINLVLGYILNFIGGNVVNWKIQHNNLHHMFTNISGKDDDISRIYILRFSPHEKRLKIHKFQHIYAWFLYGLMTISWVTKKEFLQLIEYKKLGLTKKYGSFSSLMTKLVIWKVVYFSYILLLPFLITPYAAWIILLAFFLMQYIAGFMLSIIFQTAHVMPDNEFPVPDSDGVMNENWVVHQLKTTSNYSHRSIFFSWFIGGLNYQIEHHLFPSVCHIHYKKISAIVKRTANEYGFPYNSEKTFIGALVKHTSLLKYFGKA